MSRLEPSDYNDDYIRRIVRSELQYHSPQMAIVTDVYPHTEPDDNSNYEVELELVGTRAPDSEDRKTLPRVPVSTSIDGASRGIQIDATVMVEYLNGEKDNPIVTDVLYDDERRSPLTNEGEFRHRIGDDAVIEIVEGEDGGQMVNIGRQPDDHEGIDMGISLNLSDGSFSLFDSSEKGLFFDGEGNAVMNWESMAMPWGAAGPVEWDEHFAGYSSDDETSLLSVTVEDEYGQTLEDADVTVEEANQ